MSGCCDDTTNPIIPNIIGGGCTTIDKTDPLNWIISSACPSEVVSTDNSVVITETVDPDTDAIIYDLSFQCCDSKVSVCAGDDEPGSLQEKLFVESPIVREIDCDDGTYTISLDIDALSALLPDQYVKVRGAGDSDYLENLLSVNGGGSGPLEDTISNNNYDISIDEDDDHWKRPCGVMRYGSSVTLNSLTHASNGIVDLTGFTNTNENDSAVTATSNVLIAPKAGRYAISVRGLLEVNEGLSAVRVVLASSNVVNSLAIDWKAGAGNSTRGIDSSGDGDSLYDGVPLMTVNGHTIIECVAGEQLRFVLRRDTNISPITTPGKIRIVGDDGSPFTGASAGGFSASLHFIDDVF